MGNHSYTLGLLEAFPTSSDNNNINDNNHTTTTTTTNKQIQFYKSFWHNGYLSSAAREVIAKQVLPLKFHSKLK
jgi:hypothetical protein